MKHVYGYSLALALAVSSALTAPAAADPVSGLKNIEIVNGWRRPDGQHMAAVHIRLEDGWKTYWRAPGGTGIPATFDWTGSENLSGVRFHWPAPAIYDDDGIVTIGYKTELVLPVELSPTKAGDPIVISTELELGICADVCVPTTARLTAVLMPDGNIGQAIISAALATVPVASDKAGITNVSCTLSPTQHGFTVTAQFRHPNTLTDTATTLFEYPHPDVWIESTKMQRSGRDVTVTAQLFNFSDAPLILDRRKMRMTVLDHEYAADIQGCPAS